LRELVRVNDPVLVSAVGALLDGAGIRYQVLDQNMSVIEGSLGILPRRIMVDDDKIGRIGKNVRDDTIKSATGFQQGDSGAQRVDRSRDVLEGKK